MVHNFYHVYIKEKLMPKCLLLLNKIIKYDFFSHLRRVIVSSTLMTVVLTLGNESNETAFPANTGFTSPFRKLPK